MKHILEENDSVRFKCVRIQRPLPWLFSVLDITHYLAEFHSYRNAYSPFTIGFYPIINKPGDMIFTIFKPEKGRLISPDPFHIGNENYLTDCNETKKIIEYQLNRKQMELLNQIFAENYFVGKKTIYYNINQKYSMLSIQNNSYNCKTWLWNIFPQLEKDTWCYRHFIDFFARLKRLS